MSAFKSSFHPENEGLSENKCYFWKEHRFLGRNEYLLNFWGSGKRFGTGSGTLSSIIKGFLQSEILICLAKSSYAKSWMNILENNFIGLFYREKNESSIRLKIWYRFRVEPKAWNLAVFELGAFLSQPSNISCNNAKPHSM